MSGIPHDIATEEAIIGRLLAAPHVTGDVAAVVSPGDFYKPALGTMFALLVGAWQDGRPHDSVSFSGAHGDVMPLAEVSRMLAIAPAGHTRLVERLVALRIRRDLLRLAEEARVAALDYTIDPLEARDAIASAVQGIEIPLEPVRDLWDWDDYLNRPQSDIPWLIPGLFKPGWRGLIVGLPGTGKSFVAKQVALAAASGVHPFFTSDPIEPIRTLTVDLENPPDAIDLAGNMVRTAAGTAWSRGRGWLWPRPGGLNIRNRADRSKLESVIAQCRPQFVAIGPLYKMYSSTSRESDEQAAAETQGILDDLRTRYGFALLIEHHGSKAQTNARDLLPHGSSLWLRWPELGLKLMPHENSDGTQHPTKLDVGRFRPDRLPTRWPDRIDYGQSWPWIGEWNEAYSPAGDGHGPF